MDELRSISVKLCNHAQKDFASRMTFSLKAMLVVAALVRLALGLYVVTSPLCLVGELLALICFAGVESYNAENSIPFWQCLACRAVLPILLTLAGQHWSSLRS